ncbi:unnamed protein product [Gongylonema pulchrum]|uniref:Armadillo-type fold n=1 Tax=Gongylonema pulchrum TaxID=637853 RepID=A0A183DSS2_9BILA|nr:unnamed protein product [Gongylonema pulchrum]
MSDDDDALRASIAAAASAAHRFYTDISADVDDECVAASLQARLTELVRATCELEGSARLRLSYSPLCELLRYSALLLKCPGTPLLAHLWLCFRVPEALSSRSAWPTEPDRHIATASGCCRCIWLCSATKYCSCLYSLCFRCLRTRGASCSAHGPVPFICAEEPEWLPYCLAVLCNLATRSTSSSYKAFSQKLLKLLAHDSRTVVISSLVLVGFLEEKLRDTRLVIRDASSVGAFLETCTGSCSLRRTTIGRKLQVHSIPAITSTGKNLASYSYFEQSIQLVANLLVQIDPRTEESLKVYDVLLSFCSVSQLRCATAPAVLRCQAPERSATPASERSTTPVLAICNTAGMSFEEAIEPEVPLRAIRLLIFLLQDLLEKNGRVRDALPCECILRLIEQSSKTAVETVSDCVRFQCNRIAEGLRLAEIVSNDDDLRADLLEVLSAPLCSHIVESQMISNPVVTFHISQQQQPVAPHRTDAVPPWCIDGVAIVLEMLRLLATLKDHSKPHKDLYWKLLKDDRLVPFVAYALAHGGYKLTHEALLLYTHCAQIHSFPTKWYMEFRIL